jgi:Transposase DDE domain group 1
VRLQLHALAYNLGNFLRTLATPEPIKDWSLTSLKEKLIKIGAKVVSHGRYVAFQMAEVAIPRQMFQKISDPWRRMLERALPADVTAVSTVALCDLLGIRPNTGNARRIARTMRAMGIFPIKSRKLLPGGWRGSEGRGWARPIRDPNHASLKQTESVKSSQLNSGTL